MTNSLNTRQRQYYLTIINMTHAVNRYQLFMETRLHELFPESVQQRLMGKSNPRKLGWNPRIEMCLEIPHTAMRWLVTGVHFKHRQLSAIRISSGGKIERGSFSLDSILKHKNIVRVDDFKPQSWFRYCYMKYRPSSRW